MADSAVLVSDQDVQAQEPAEALLTEELLTEELLVEEVSIDGMCGVY